MLENVLLANLRAGFASCAAIEARFLLVLNRRGIDYLTPSLSGDEEAQIDSMAAELEKLKLSDNREQQFLKSSLLMHLHLLQKKYDEVIEQSSKSDFSTHGTTLIYTYSKVAALRQCAISGTAYEAQNNFSKAIRVYQAASELFDAQVASSKEGLIWAEQLYYRFGMLVTSLSWDDRETTLDALHSYQKVSKLMNDFPSQIGADPLSTQRRLTFLNVQFMYLSSLLQLNSDDTAIRDELHEVSKAFQETLFDSTTHVTSDSSNAPVEQFVDVLVTNWHRSVNLVGPLELVVDPRGVEETKELLTVLQQAAVKTFHSCAIMRYLVVVLTSLGQYDEALHAFDTYIAYQEMARRRQASAKASNEFDSVQHEKLQSGDNDKAVVRVFAKAIDLIVRVKKDGALARDTADKLRSWLNNEDLIGTQSKNRKWSHEHKVSTASAISADLSDGFGVVWAAIARAYALYANQATTTEEREVVYELAVSSYENSLRYHPEEGQIYFDFALLLAENSQLNRAMKVVREGLMVDKSHVKLWHLIGLLLSAVDDFEKAAQAISNAIKLLSKKGEGGVHTIPSFEKSQYLQLKMTEVALYEASEGIDKALELIPEVFLLYGDLHPPVVVPDEIASPHEEDMDTELSPTRSSILRIKNLKPSLGLTKTLSRTGLRGNKASHPSSPKASHMSTPSRIAPPNIPSMVDKSSRKDLHSLWLWTAGLYRRGGLYAEAQEAIVEAERVRGHSADGHIELGLLLKAEQPSLALAEFESALHEDKYNARAIVALGQLIYEQSEASMKDEQEEEAQESLLNEIVNKVNGVSLAKANGNGKSNSTDDYESSTENSTDSSKEPPYGSIFISKDDQLAAVTRAQGLLDLLLQSGHGFNCSEAWWLMSLFQERSQDKVGATASLWKSVGLEESRAVRSFSVLHFELPDPYRVK